MIPGRTNKPGTFQTPKLYTCQVSFKTSLSFLLVLKFCTKGEILFEVSSRTPIEVSGLGFLPKGKDADNQSKKTPAKCPALRADLSKTLTQGRNYSSPAPGSLCKELVTAPSVLSPLSTQSDHWMQSGYDAFKSLPIPLVPCKLSIGHKPLLHSGPIQPSKQVLLPFWSQVWWVKKSSLGRQNLLQPKP